LNSSTNVLKTRSQGKPGWRRNRVSLRRVSFVQLPEAVPHLVVVLLQLRRLERELGRPEYVARLPHEGERVLDLVGLQLGRARLFERSEIPAVRGHVVVDRDPAGEKALGLGVVNP